MSFSRIISFCLFCIVSVCISQYSAFAIQVKAHDIQIAVTDDSLLTPVAPKVKNYLEDGKTTPAYDLKGAGNVQLLDVGPKRIADIVFGFFSIIAVIISMRAGISVLFSKGDAAKFKNGIMAIVYAAIGIVLIGSAWIIVRLVLQINLGN